MNRILVAYCLAAGFLFAEEGSHQAAATFSGEMVVSKLVHSGNLRYSLAYGKAGVSGTYYGAETFDVGALIADKPIRPKPWLTLFPGFGAGMIKTCAEHEEHDLPHHEPAALEPYRSIEPVFSFRWKLEKKWLVSEGNWLSSLLATNGRRNSYSDGSHISVKLRRFEVGIPFALANHGLEHERKTGGRLVITHKGFSFGVMALGPGKADIRAIFAYNGEHHQEE